DLAPAEHLDRMLALRQAGGPQRLRVHLGARVETLLEIGQVDRLRVRPELLERHRHLLVRAAQLAHPHVDRVLPALVIALVLRARARAGALVAAARGLALARAFAAAEPLAGVRRARLRADRVQADVLGIEPAHQSLTS